jgi:hypothetical protein
VCRWLYCLFLAIDANFRLKLKTRGIKDPELGAGLAYFVDTVKFQNHLKNHVHEEDVSLSISLVLNDVDDLDRSRPVGQNSMQLIKQIQGYQRISQFLASVRLSAAMA